MSRVSVVIPVFNAARTLAATLRSALAQTHRDIEVIAIDDGSQDSSADCIRGFARNDSRVQLISGENAGVATARNLGIAAATGDWVAPLDADDLWHPEKIARQLQAARSSPWDPVFVYAWSRRIDIDGRVKMDLGQPSYRGDVLAPLVASNFMRNSSVPLIRRSALEAAGGYDAGLQAAGAHGAEDLSLYLKLAEAGPAELAPAFLIGYRHFPGTMSRDPDRMRRSIDRVLGELTQRRLDIPEDLLRLARMNYDFYSATLLLSAGDRAGFLAYIGRGLQARPMVGAAFLGCHLIERAWSALAQSTFAARGRSPLFEDLPADRPLVSGAQDLIDRLQARAAGQAVAGSAMSGSRWSET